MLRAGLLRGLLGVGQNQGPHLLRHDRVRQPLQLGLLLRRPKVRMGRMTRFWVPSGRAQILAPPLEPRVARQFCCQNRPPNCGNIGATK